MVIRITTTNAQWVKIMHNAFFGVKYNQPLKNVFLFLYCFCCCCCKIFSFIRNVTPVNSYILLDLTSYMNRFKYKLYKYEKINLIYIAINNTISWKNKRINIQQAPSLEFSSIQSRNLEVLKKKNIFNHHFKQCLLSI